MSEEIIYYIRKRTVIISLCLIFINNTSCTRNYECFSSYNQVVNSTYYKGGWIPNEVLPKSSYNICIKNDIDVNRAWLSLSFKKNDSLIEHLKGNTFKKKDILKLFENQSSNFGESKTYWSQPVVIFGKISDNQYFAINRRGGKLYYLRTKY